MPINFFEKELTKVQERYNETYGQLTVCDIQTRQKVILNIIAMCRLKDKIMKGGVPHELHENRGLFVRRKNWVNAKFDAIQQILNERKVQDDSNSIAVSRLN